MRRTHFFANGALADGQAIGVIVRAAQIAVSSEKLSAQRTSNAVGDDGLAVPEPPKTMQRSALPAATASAAGRI